MWRETHPQPGGARGRSHSKPSPAMGKHRQSGCLPQGSVYTAQPRAALSTPTTAGHSVYTYTLGHCLHPHSRPLCLHPTTLGHCVYTPQLQTLCLHLYAGPLGRHPSTLGPRCGTPTPCAEHGAWDGKAPGTAPELLQLLPELGSLETASGQTMRPPARSDRKLASPGGSARTTSERTRWARRARALGRQRPTPAPALDPAQARAGPAAAPRPGLELGPGTKGGRRWPAAPSAGPQGAGRPSTLRSAGRDGPRRARARARGRKKVEAGRPAPGPQPTGRSPSGRDPLRPRAQRSPPSPGAEGRGREGRGSSGAGPPGGRGGAAGPGRARGGTS